MFAIFKRELKAFYLTPFGYVFMSSFLFISGLIFTSHVVFAKTSLYAEYLGTIIFLFIIVIPLLTMKTFSEEKKNRTDQLLLTLPITSMAIVLGKFLASFTVFLLTVFITFLYPLFISFYGELEIPKIIGSYSGFIFLGGSLVAIGIFVSSLTENMASSAVLSFCIYLFIWSIDLIITILPSDSLSGLIFILIIFIAICYKIYKESRNLFYSVGVYALVFAVAAFIFFVKREVYISLLPECFSFLSLTSRFEKFPIGIIKVSDIIFFISIMIFFLYLTGQQIEKRRWSRGQ